MITVSAPGKLLLMGEHAVVYGRPCIVTAVNARLSVSVEKRRDSGVVIDAPQVSDTKFVSRAIETVRARWKEEVSGITVHTKSEFSSSFGFGSSAAVTVAMVFALREFLGKKGTPGEIFELSYKTTKEVQRGGSGFDVAAATWGGALYYKNEGEVVEPMAVPPPPIIIGYTGVKADTMTIVRDVGKKRDSEPQKVERIFDAIGKLVEEARMHMGEGDWERVGKLFDFNQEYLRDLGVSSEKLEALILAAKNAGAWGAKLSGAGGSDCMIAITPQDRRQAVEKAIVAAGGEVLRFSLNAEGVRRDA